MSKTQIISDGIVFIDCDSGSEIDAGVAGQKIGVHVPVKNITTSGYIILLHAQLFKDGTLIEDNLIHSELYVNGGVTKEWYSEFYMPDADVLITAHSYVWPDYPPSSPDYTTMVTLPLGAAVGWIKVAEVNVTATVGYPGGWIEIAGVNATATVGYPGGWIKVAEVSAVASPPGLPPCQTDADCPAGYVCVNGKCVKKPPSEVPWGWIAAGTAVAGGVVLLTGKEKPKKRT